MNFVSPLGPCSPQSPLEPKLGCCTQTFSPPPLLLTLLACLLSFLRCPQSTDKLYHYFFHGKIHLPASCTALGFTSKRCRDFDQVEAMSVLNCDVWLNSPSRPRSPRLANPREAQAAADGSAARCSGCPESRTDKAERRSERASPCPTTKLS